MNLSPRSCRAERSTIVAEQSDLLSVMHQALSTNRYYALAYCHMINPLYTMITKTTRSTPSKLGASTLNHEMTCLAFCLQENNRRTSPKAVNVDFDLKGHIENLFAGLDIELVSMQSHVHPPFHPDFAKIIHGDFELGILGQIHQNYKSRHLFW